MKKKIMSLNRRIALLGVLLLLSSLSLSACGGGGGGGGGTVNNGPFLALSSSGTGTFTDTSNDTATDYLDITGATVAINPSNITCTITLRNLPPTLTFNEAGVPQASLEYRWGIQFDTNSDNSPNYSMEISHIKYTDPEVTGGIITNTDADVWKYDSPDSWSSIVPITASITGPTITMTVLRSAFPTELNNITSSAKVRIFTYKHNSSFAFSDFVD